MDESAWLKFLKMSICSNKKKITINSLQFFSFLQLSCVLKKLDACKFKKLQVLSITFICFNFMQDSTSWHIRCLWSELLLPWDIKDLCSFFSYILLYFMHLIVAGIYNHSIWTGYIHGLGTILSTILSHRGQGSLSKPAHNNFNSETKDRGRKGDGQN